MSFLSRHQQRTRPITKTRHSNDEDYGIMNCVRNRYLGGVMAGRALQVSLQGRHEELRSAIFGVLQTVPVPLWDQQRRQYLPQ